MKIVVGTKVSMVGKVGLDKGRVPSGENFAGKPQFDQGRRVWASWYINGSCEGVLEVTFFQFIL